MVIVVPGMIQPSLSVIFFDEMRLYRSSVVPEPEGPGGPLAPSIFGRSVNPIRTGGGQIIPTYYYWHWHPQCFSPSGITGTYSNQKEINVLFYERVMDVVLTSLD
jgi:hypothetical protein